MPKLPPAGDLTRQQKVRVREVHKVVEAAAGGSEGLPRLLAEVARVAGLPNSATAELDRATIVLKRGGELFSLQGTDHEGRRYVLQLVAGVYSLGELHDFGFNGLGANGNLLRSSAAHVRENGVQ